MVVVGAHDLSNSEILDHISVRNYIPHPDYIICNLQNDIMLLMLYKKVRLNNNVGLISLPKNNKDVSVDTLCSVAGWGRLWTTGSPSDRLMEANVTTLNHEECQRKWELSYSALQMICAYGSGGSCKGDSGGPLVCGDTAVGVTSFGSYKLCNSPEQPNVYTKISAYLPWIHQNIRKVNAEERRVIHCTLVMCVSSQGHSGDHLVCGDTAVGVTTFVYKELCDSPQYPNAVRELIDSLIVFMMTIISLLLLASLLPHLTFTGETDQTKS
ncbi:hypothetical protein cypCar_00042710 [Cyprinus carpio]|nr:hypothetical protein cypCar_00042710 [Cyprinus carpio]